MRRFGASANKRSMALAKTKSVPGVSSAAEPAAIAKRKTSTVGFMVSVAILFMQMVHFVALVKD
ncbi:hypothetical protein JI59_05045 [Novosphingobium pentaromativorans US6-1]|uniref:Uncharacterized protein n=1 Tax=Novosphingobium pentaromativorans US6-1 TaxID=1088721 RepID=G6EF70_9SPHN|nr:hypothetical protein JI59_05045 [Novosphingobium pentaromativorans US6-1]EHJ60028.1 hypothetical protein NSU_2991 [Novosphingobium pentaromativorans US6-1]